MLKEASCSGGTLAVLPGVPAVGRRGPSADAGPARAGAPAAQRAQQAAAVRGAQGEDPGGARGPQAPAPGRGAQKVQWRLVTRPGPCLHSHQGALVQGRQARVMWLLSEEHRQHLEGRILASGCWSRAEPICTPQSGAVWEGVII